MSIKSIAIIGAGWSGLQISRILLDCGYSVKIFEELNDVGGSWHPNIAYHGQALHTPILMCQFDGFEFSDKRNPLKRVNWVDVFNNCKNYCKSNELYKIITFNSKVTSVKYYTDPKKCVLNIKNLQNGEEESQEFDFVISTQFNSPRIPSFKGEEKFEGKIYHSSQIKEDIFNDIIKNDKKVVILGASKSATDLIYEFSKRNFNVDWVFRKMYWFFAYDKIWFNHKKGKPASILNRFVLLFCFMLLTNRILCYPGFVILRLLRIIICPGKKHSDYKRFHGGFLDQYQFDSIKNYKQIYSEIESLDKKSINLCDKRSLECDVLICATGCDPISDQIELYVNDKELKYENIECLYQDSVISAIPRLCFTGFTLLGFALNRCVHMSAWILKYIEQDFSTQKINELSRDNQSKSESAFHNPLFDSSHFIILVMKKQITDMLSGMTSNIELFSFLYNQIIRFKVAPLSGVVKFINKKRISRNNLDDRVDK